jgi:hypothetical protein
MDGCINLLSRPKVPVHSVSVTPSLIPYVVVVAIAPSTNKRRPVLNVDTLLPRLDLSTGPKREREERLPVPVVWLT